VFRISQTASDRGAQASDRALASQALISPDSNDQETRTVTRKTDDVPHLAAESGRHPGRVDVMRTTPRWTAAKYAPVTPILRVSFPFA